MIYYAHGSAIVSAEELESDPSLSANVSAFYTELSKGTQGLAPGVQCANSSPSSGAMASGGAAFFQRQMECTLKWLTFSTIEEDRMSRR